METGASASDVWAVAVAVVALLVAIGGTVYTVQHGARSQRLATFERLHEALIDPKAARGRKLLFVGAADGRFPTLGDPDWDQINYAMALYDTLGGYLELGLVDRDVVLAAWYHPVVAISGPIQKFLAHRITIGIDQPWAYLLQLMSLMQVSTCLCPTCRVAPP